MDADLVAADQWGTGRSLRVDRAQLRRSPGFVAVYTADGEQLLGSVAVPRSAGAASASDDDDEDDDDDDDDAGDDDAGDDDDGGDDDAGDDDGGDDDGGDDAGGGSDGGDDAGGGSDGAVVVGLDPVLTGTTRLLVVLHADNGDRRFQEYDDPRVSGGRGELEVDRITYRVR